MFEKVCLECYDDENGPITKINRKDGDGPMDDEPEMCDCGEAMYYVHTRNGPLVGGDYSHTSASLAINPCQTKAHKKLFPGVDVLPDGQIRFNSVKQQSDYCDKTGFDKATQKIRKKGVRIE